MITAPQFFATSRNVSISSGKCYCYYCGGLCGVTYSRKKFVKPTFSDTDIVVRSSSQFVCRGCVECLNEKADITLIDGEKRSNQRIRNYSWLITKEECLAATKAHKKEILNWIQTNDKTPYVLCISDSGQKQFLPHISRVSNSLDPVCGNLDNEYFSISQIQLQDYLDITGNLVAVLGSPSLGQTLSLSQKMQLYSMYGSDYYVNLYKMMYTQPEFKLALWLTPPKKECESLYLTSTTKSK